MEFHDVLHGLIKVDSRALSDLLADLLDTAEIHRLRNMRQMNFDVPLIQELGRSRRLPHSIGVVYIAMRLAQKSGLSLGQTKTLVAAALLHDAAIPPYGHLVESELKALSPNFNHANILEKLISGTASPNKDYEQLVPGKYAGVRNVLISHQINPKDIFDLTYPRSNHGSPISSHIDIDNIDNVHRMAVMLGWHDARNNLSQLLSRARLHGLSHLTFDDEAEPYIRAWLDYRQRIYTMIIAHPECVPYNALQADLCRAAVEHQIISEDEWYITEPLFEEKLRNNPLTEDLANQIISGCNYKLLDYVWIKGFQSNVKESNASIAGKMNKEVDNSNRSHFVWLEKGLISRQVKWHTAQKGWKVTGDNSSSCMVALLHTEGAKSVQLTKIEKEKWRRETSEKLCSIFGTDSFYIDYPESYSGSFNDHKNHELQFDAS